MVILNCRAFLILLFFGFGLTGFSQTRNLEYYINEGLRNSPVLTDLQNQLTSSSVDSLLIEAQRKPQIEGKSLLLYSPFTKNFGYDEVITDGGNYQAVAYVSQIILNRKIIDNKYQAAGIQKKSIGISRKLSVAELKRSITNLYLQSYSDFSEYLFNSSFFELLENEVSIINQFVINGICNKTDYLSLLVETEGQAVLVNQLHNQFKKDIRSLNEICGITDTGHVVLLLPSIYIREEASPAEYIFLKQFGIDSLQIINEKTALDLKYRPAVTWFADAGVLTSKPFNFYRHFGASAGISFTVPIYDGHQKKLDEQKLSLKEETRFSYKNSSRKVYDQQFLRLKGEMEGMEEVKIKIENQLAISDQLVKSLKAQLESGIIMMTDYINAIKNYRNISRNLNLVNIEILLLRNEMNYIITQ
jgi:hypothetical protein